MLVDEAFQSQLASMVAEQRCSAEGAVETVLDHYRAQFTAADSEYLRQRAADIDDIERDLLGYLNRERACRRCADAAGCGVRHCRLGHDHILVGEALDASLPIEADHCTRGFVVARGGPNSHAVILARASGRPVVGNIHDPFGAIPVGAQLLIDGHRGEVILNPGEETRARYRLGPAGHRPAFEATAPVPGLQVMANIGQATEASDALAAGAEGIGLYRTEMEVLAAGHWLSEAEQVAAYSAVLRAMADKPVCIRLLDLSNDKTAAWIHERPRGNSAADPFGARLLLARPELLRDQARALARASVHGPIRVLYPMITSVEEFLRLRSAFDAAVADLRPIGLQHGVLFEVPAACLTAAPLMQAADFGCIGTNDLIQYLFAAQRNQGDTASHSAFETHAVLWALIQSLSWTARRAAKPMTICGELAGNPELTGRILRSGLTVVSTSPSRIAAVRRAARKALPRCPAQVAGVEQDLDGALA
jgi:phosphotransferase system enzyme I (PtsI)